MHIYRSELVKTIACNVFDVGLFILFKSSGDVIKREAIAFLKEALGNL